MLAGERRGRVFRLGDRLRVLVLKASMEERKIDFRLVERSMGEQVPQDVPPRVPRGKSAKRKKVVRTR